MKLEDTNQKLTVFMWWHREDGPDENLVIIVEGEVTEEEAWNYILDYECNATREENEMRSEEGEEEVDMPTMDDVRDVYDMSLSYQIVCKRV